MASTQSQQQQDSMFMYERCSGQQSVDTFTSYNDMEEDTFKLQVQQEEGDVEFCDEQLQQPISETQELQTELEKLNQLGEPITASPDSLHTTSQQFIANRVLHLTQSNSYKENLFDDEKYVNQNDTIDTSGTTACEGRDTSALSDEDEAELAAWLDQTATRIQTITANLRTPSPKSPSLSTITKTHEEEDFEAALDDLDRIGEKTPSKPVHNMKLAPPPSPHLSPIKAIQSPVAVKLEKNTPSSSEQKNESKKLPGGTPQKPIHIRNTPRKNLLVLEKGEVEEIQQFTPPQLPKPVIVKDEIGDADRDSFESQSTPHDQKATSARSTSPQNDNTRSKSPSSIASRYDPGKDRKAIFDYFGIMTYQRGNEYACEGHVWNVQFKELMDIEGIKLCELKTKCWGTTVEPYDQEIIFNAPTETTALTVQRAKCTCPVSLQCKHCAAAVLTYLDCLEKKTKFPVTGTMASQLSKVTESLKEKEDTIANLLNEQSKEKLAYQTLAEEKKKIEGNMMKVSTDLTKQLEAKTATITSLSLEVKQLKDSQIADRDELHKLKEIISSLEQRLKSAPQIQKEEPKPEVIEEEASQPLFDDDDDEDNPFSSANSDMKQEPVQSQEEECLFNTSPAQSVGHSTQDEAEDLFGSYSDRRMKKEKMEDEEDPFASPSNSSQDRFSSTSASVPSFLATPATPDRKRKRSQSTSNDDEPLFDDDENPFDDDFSSPTKKQRRVHFQL